MTNQSTPVTDDDRRKLHEDAQIILKTPGSRRTAVRLAEYVVANVPAPPATLADEMREVAENYGMSSRAAERVDALADRVEAVEKERNVLQDVVDGSAADLQQRDDEIERLDAEVERLTALNAEKSTHIQEQGREIGEYIAALNAQTSERTVKYSRTVAPDLLDPADVPEREPYLVTFEGGQWIGLRNDPADEDEPWHLTHLTRSFADWASDKDITLVSRLVPDVRRVIDRPEDLDALPVGSVVVSQYGKGWVKTLNGGWTLSGTPVTSKDIIDTLGPVTVIHEGVTA